MNKKFKIYNSDSYMNMKNYLKGRKLVPVITTGILLMLAPYLLYTGCIKVVEERIPVTLSVSANSINFGAAGEQKSFTVTSNATWTVNNDASWLTVSPSGNSVSVVATANTSTSLRQANITISSRVPGVPEQSVAMTQNGITPELTVSTTSLSFVTAGEQKPFSINSNLGWTISSSASSWLTVNLSSGNGNSTINATATANTATSQRTATITISGGEITRTINATQTGTISPYEPEMIFVQGGTFMMGCTSEQGDDCWSDETPNHRVTLSDFYIGKYEVTTAQWGAVMEYYTTNNSPVTNISWIDVQEYITKLNNLTGKQYRLPTEAEWEFAARGGNSSKGYKYSGSNTIGNVAWYRENSSNKIYAVGTKSPNELGIYDMSGNAEEWCSDWYDSGYYSSSAQTNPTGPSTGTVHVFRGGAYFSEARYLRVSSRDKPGVGSTLGYFHPYLGFRLASSSK